VRKKKKRHLFMMGIGKLLKPGCPQCLGSGKPGKVCGPDGRYRRCPGCKGRGV
jgi:hypothetical protein